MSSLTQEEADDLFDTLQADIEAAAAQEIELELVLTRLEELILVDILAGDYDENEYDAPASGSVTPSTASTSVTPSASEYGGNETFIQQKSLALLPLLCRFPLFTSKASDKLINLIVLVSRRLNPKELWLGLDSVFETSRVGLEALADGDAYDEDGLEDEDDSDAELPNGVIHDSPEHISVYLSRALLAVQIVLPRIHVKKPEKYLKPILDALTGCLTAFQSPDLRSQIAEPELFNPTLLLVNLAKAVREAYVWAETRQVEGNPSLKLSLSRLYLLGIRSVLPLCPEAGHFFNLLGRAGMAPISTIDLKMILLEPAIVLDLDSWEEMKQQFLLTTAKPKEPETDWPKQVQSSTSHIILGALRNAGAKLFEDTSRDVLKMLPRMLEMVLEEDMDEPLRTLALDAVLFLGHASTSGGEVILTKRKTAKDDFDESQLPGCVKAAVQVLVAQFDDIAVRPPLNFTAPAPARKALDLCEALVLDKRLGTHQRDELIALLLKDSNPHIRSVGVTVLRKLVTGTEHGIHPVLPDFSVCLFDHTISQDDLVDERSHAWLVSLLNFVYILNTRLARLELAAAQPTQDIQQHFMEALGGELEVALKESTGMGGPSSEEGDQEALQDQMQLEILHEAWQKASHQSIATKV